MRSFAFEGRSNEFQRSRTKAHGQYEIGEEGHPRRRPPYRDQQEPHQPHPHYVRKVEEAIAAGNQTEAQAALQAAQPELMRGAQKGVLHKNTASRKVSRLAARVKALKA
jgi:hypothetical protein